AAVLAVSDIRVRFPGAGESVTRWQGNLTPVVNYF
ncbi:fimbrial protein, partial [Salmonella enterica]|nr:fimbrial protein [Salmonella enterica]